MKRIKIPSCSKKGIWKIVDNRPFSTDEDAWPPPQSIKDCISGEYSLYIMQSPTGEIKFFDIQVLIYDSNYTMKIVDEIKMKLESLGAPKGSFIEIEGKEEKISFGKKEGLAIYLDGVNLPENVYKECDSNYVVSEIFRLTGCNDDIIRFWEGDTETAIYFYGESFDNMKRDIFEFVNTYPLCKGARIVQIA